MSALRQAQSKSELQDTVRSRRYVVPTGRSESFQERYDPRMKLDLDERIRDQASLFLRQSQHTCRDGRVLQRAAYDQRSERRKHNSPGVGAYIEGVFIDRLPVIAVRFE